MAETNVNSLAKAMREMKASDDNALKTAFVRELIKTKLYLPVNISPEPENGVVKDGSTVSYISLRNNKDDRKLLIAFSSRTEYDKFAKGGLSSYIVIHSYNEAAMIVRSRKFDGIIIDAAGENVAVSKELIERIAQSRPQFSVTNEKVTVKAGQAPLSPASAVNEEFKSALAAYLETQENINKCYLMETMRVDEEVPTTVVVLDFEGDISSTFNGVAKALRKHMKKNETFGMMSTEDKIAADAVAEVEPFYVKK